MNSKKAKRLRQLVRHLQNKAAVESTEWVDIKDDPMLKKIPQDDGSTSIAFGITRKLKPECGRSIYQMMKKTA